MSQQQQQQHEVDWSEILSSVPYPIEAFAFVREGLNYAVEAVHDDPESLPEDERHISGQQLCMGLRDMAITKYGLLAPVVFEHWGVTETVHFGEIVFSLVRNGLMSKTDEDRLEDFENVYRFSETFDPKVIQDELRDLDLHSF